MNARSPDAADADDLVGHVDDFEPFEEVAAIVRQRLAVGAELLVDHVFHLVDREPDPRCQVSQRDHDRWLADDPVPAVDMLGQLRQRLQAVAGVRLPGLLLGGSSPRSCRAFLLPARSMALVASLIAAHELLFRQARVPDVQGAHLGELGHLCSIAATDSSVAARASDRVKPLLRAAIVKLAAMRFTSYSNGPGSVSSKSFSPNSNVRSGDANAPKFERCASPHSWTFKSCCRRVLRDPSP